MNAEIIAVGSELLTPQRLDTNSLYLTDQLNALGVEVVQKIIVGDERARLAREVRAAVERSGVVILSGGLGPTEDDVTRDAVAEALGRGQNFHAEIVEWMEDRFRRMNRKMAEVNRRQAFVLDGAEVLRNDRGTAPGQWIEHGDAVVMLLPGPPNELQHVFERECLTRLRAKLPPMAIHARVYRVAGMAESDLDQLISPVYKKYENPVTTVLAAPGDIQVHLRARCATPEEAESLVAALGGEIEALLGDRIYSRAGEPLERVVGDMLRARRATLSVAESCTGGMLGERITAVAGSSDYFAGGFLVYTDRLKTELLGVDAALIREHTSVSEPVAAAMARGARERAGATCALSVTGVAGPDGGDQARPVGTVFVGLAGPEGCRVRRFQFVGDRQRIRTLAAQYALDLLRRNPPGLS